MTRLTVDGEIWFHDTVDGVVPFEGMKSPKTGDSVLATQSAEQLFKENPHKNVKFHPQSSKTITHNEEVANPKMNRLVIKILKGKR